MFEIQSLAKGICLAMRIARNKKKLKPSLRVFLSFKSYRRKQPMMFSFSEKSRQMTLPTLKSLARGDCFKSTNYQSQSRKVLLNMMVDSSLIPLEIRANRAFRQRRSAELRGINLRLFSLFNPQATHPIRQSAVCSARSPLR
jgi:hypothetical protein